MSIDIYHSRRTNYYNCQYWIRDERNQAGSPEKWVISNQPSGNFYANLVSARINEKNIINNAWMLDSNRISLETDDHIDGLTRGCIVKFNNGLWLVDSVQQLIHNKESQFSNKLHFKSIIQLTKGN